MHPSFLRMRLLGNRILDVETILQGHGEGRTNRASVAGTAATLTATNNALMLALRLCSQVLISMGDFGKGLDYLRQAASLDPECPIPYVNAARAYLGMNDTKAARRRVF